MSDSPLRCPTNFINVRQTSVCRLLRFADLESNDKRNDKLKLVGQIRIGVKSGKDSNDKLKLVGQIRHRPTRAALLKCPVGRRTVPESSGNDRKR